MLEFQTGNGAPSSMIITKCESPVNLFGLVNYFCVLRYVNSSIAENAVSNSFEIHLL